MDQRQKHFLNRMGFGQSPETLTEGSWSTPQISDSLETQMIQTVSPPAASLKESKKLKDNPERVKTMIAEVRKQALSLNAAWIHQMKDPALGIREKMTFFWHDHFACRVRVPYLMQRQNNTLRKHALGKFGDLLSAVSKDAAMLQFLNNQQNKKNSPNENFAREVMELFTLGPGQYTEDDIKNAARAFTGWGFRPLTGEFLFRQQLHDTGVKQFRGRTGNFTGEDILGMILEDPATARFIVTKFWKFFVHPEFIHPEILTDLSQKFYNSDYDIARLLTAIASGSWFYEETYTGCRIKSPVELIVGLQIHSQGEFINPANLIFLQKALGQVLFQPPNVGGWPHNKEWIDSSSLAIRMSLPAMVLTNSEAPVETKDDGDVNNETNEIARARKLSYHLAWDKLAGVFTRNHAADTLSVIEDFLLVKKLPGSRRNMVEKSIRSSKDDIDLIKNAFIRYMSLPEYQLV